MSKGIGGLAPQKRPGIAMPSGVRSGPVSPISPSHRSLPHSSGGNTLPSGRTAGGGLRSFNSDWPAYPAGSSRRNLSGSSVPDVPPPRENMSPIRPSSGSWDMPVPSKTSATSPNKVEFVHKDLHSPGRDARYSDAEREPWIASTAPNSRVVGLTSDEERRSMPVITLNQDEIPSGVTQPMLSTTKRIEALGRDPATGRRYGNVSTPTKVASYNPVQNFINPVGHPDGAPVPSEPSDELANRFRGLAINDEYRQPSQTQNLMYQPTSVMIPAPANVPSQPNPLHIPAHHMVTHTAPSLPAYPPTFPTQADYSAYYSGVVPPTDYNYGYDAYYRGADRVAIASPVALNASVPMYCGMPPPHPLVHHVHPDMRHQPPQYYEFNSSARPPTQYTMASVPHYHPVAPVSPVQLTQTQFAVQARANGKPHAPHDQQFGPQQQRQDFSMGSRQQRRFRKPSKHSPSSFQNVPTKVPLAPFANQVPSGAIRGPNFAAGNAGPRHRDGGQLHRAEAARIPIAPTRSALLEEFRENRKRDRKWQLKELFGHIVEFSTDQHGSRFIQQSIESATDEERHRAFNEIVPDHTLNLMQDVFGNYVIQKLFEHGTPEHQAKFSDAMMGHIFELSQHVYGCRVVQKALDHIPRERQTAFVRELEPYVMECVVNANGNHVIQKLVQRLSSDQLGFIQIFCGHVGKLATHPYGCRVLQRCLENLSEFHTRSLLDELLGQCRHLMVNQYGNYIIQYVIAHGSDTDRHFLVSGLQGRVMAMAKHKFASNVVEKALVHSDPDIRANLIDELLAPQPDGRNPIQTMMRDQYANYVLQTALSVAEGPQKTILVTHVRPLLETMRESNSLFHKHLTSFEKLVGRSQEHH